VIENQNVRTGRHVSVSAWDANCWRPGTTCHVCGASCITCHKT